MYAAKYAQAPTTDGREGVDARRPDHEHHIRFIETYRVKESQCPRSCCCRRRRRRRDQRQRASAPEDGIPAFFRGQELTHGSPQDPGDATGPDEQHDGDRPELRQEAQLALR
jgi:hypothetical protein